MDSIKSKRILKKHLLHWLHQSLWLCGSQQTEKFSKRWEYQNTLPPPEKPICRSRNNGYNRTWNNRLVQNCKNSTSRLYIVTCLFNFCEEYIVQNAGLDESQSAIKSARRNINDLGYADDTTLMAKSKEELKSLLMKGEWKSWLKTQHSKSQIRHPNLLLHGK